MFVFTSWLASHEVCIHIQYFFGVLIKRRSKVQEKNMSCKRALNFDQWKTFSKNYKPMGVIMTCLQIYQKLSNLPTFLRVHSN